MCVCVFQPLSLALGDELERYLKLARTLRDGATFDSQEQVDALALQQLHRFDYNATDAACALYARHSIELPRSNNNTVVVGANRASGEPLAAWLAEFYRIFRVPTLTPDVVTRLKAHDAAAQTHADTRALTEAAVLKRLVTRLCVWEARTETLATSKVERGELVTHVQTANDLQLVAREKDALERRVWAFDKALEALKDAVDRGSRRGQAKVGLDEVRVGRGLSYLVGVPSQSGHTNPCTVCLCGRYRPVTLTNLGTYSAGSAVHSRVGAQHCVLERQSVQRDSTRRAGAHCDDRSDAERRESESPSDARRAREARARACEL